ncbi:hypothetical protein [Paenibacillus sp. JJ-223]|uniref:hypothetical protein n=1 Tax=Paenibacillus sp. JJ-223 TaxID=2905647 RepID=UPI000FBCFEF0|nr:hypothetical protein [Paenibacillus sp. JJ-223]CAH1197303.1 hypothetical protein PAECIP111890_01223 [Paenibacillus sp. JJ-223]
MFGKRLPDETVEVTSTDKGLDVTYNGQLHSIALTFTGNDRYITIRGFQELIRDKYEIRLFDFTEAAVGGTGCPVSGAE